MIVEHRTTFETHASWNRETGSMFSSFPNLAGATACAAEWRRNRPAQLECSRSPAPPYSVWITRTDVVSCRHTEEVPS